LFGVGDAPAHLEVVGNRGADGGENGRIQHRTDTKPYTTKAIATNPGRGNTPSCYAKSESQPRLSISLPETLQIQKLNHMDIQMKKYTAIDTCISIHSADVHNLPDCAL